MQLLSCTLVLAIASQVLAFPAIAAQLAKDAKPLSRRVAEELEERAVGFDPKQLISTSGQYAFKAPGAGDQRGPCPGLNAMANHGYMPHNGVATIQQFIDGTTKVFGMGADLAAFLAIYGAIFDGNLASWSIGGPTPNVATVTGLLSQPQGISYSHNKYESDVSPTRGDLYTHNGDAYTVQLDQFKALYAKQSAQGDAANYNLPVLTEFRHERFQNSIATNPYFFNGPFSGVAVQPAAYTFIYRFMANHSAAAPEGILSKNVLKSFFSITGDDNNLAYKQGYERIPDNWYRRAFGDEYTIPYFVGDLNAAALTYPEFLNIGGNTGKVNSFTGVDLTNLTGGVYNTKNIAQGNNAACLAFQSITLAAPDLLQGVLVNVQDAVAKVASAVSNGIAQLGCPQLTKYDLSAFSGFPGYTKLKPSGTY